MSHMIAPSILAADFGHLKRDIDMLNSSDADWIHVDVMDGVFVPNISFGFPVLKFLKSNAKKPLDVHLMIVEPDRYVKDFYEAGANTLTVQYEACTHLHRTLELIKGYNMMSGVALNPHTPVNVLEDIIQDIDMVLIMSVNPGFGGQKFIEHSYEKTRKLKQLITTKNASAKIEIDGGIDLSNARKVVDAGVDVLVTGTTVFAADNPNKMITELKNA